MKKRGCQVILNFMQISLSELKKAGSLMELIEFVRISCT